MTDQAKDLGLKCPKNGTSDACSDSEAPVADCWTVDHCDDNSCNCSDSNVVAAASDHEEPVQDLTHECLDGKYYDCPNLETPFVGCCSQDPCLSRCPAAHLRVAVANDLIFNMVGVESMDDSASTKITGTPQATSTGETAHTSLLTSVITTATFFPTGTISSSGVAEKTVMVADPHGKDDLSDTQELGIGITAGVIGFIIIGCIVHRVIVYNRKRRPGYPHRTDHDPLWQPPPSPISLNSLNAPGTRRCGLDRVPGEATRPGSWGDKANNAAEAELMGFSGPRRVRSAEPARLLHSVATDQVRGSGQLSQHSLPLPDARGRFVDGPRSAGAHFGRQHRPQGWVTSAEHAEYHGHYSDNGDFSVNVQGYGQGSCQYRHPAARSDEQLSRFVSYPPAAEVRAAPRSDGPGRALSLNHYASKTYQAYTPPAGSSAHQSRSGASRVDSSREVYELPAEPLCKQTRSGESRVDPSQEVYELPAEPVGELTDSQARALLGERRLLNPDLRESTMADTEEVQDKTEANTSEFAGDSLETQRTSILGESKNFSKAEGKNSGEDQGVGSIPAVSSAATEEFTSLVGETEAGRSLRLTSASTSDPNADDEKVVPKVEVQAVGAVESAASDAEVPRLDATGGLPSFTDNLSASCPGGLTTSSAAQASPTLQREPPRVHNFDIPQMPRVIAAPRRRPSGLYMNVPADDVRPDQRHLPGHRQFAGRAAHPFHTPREYPAHVPASRTEHPTAQGNNTLEGAAHPHPGGPVHGNHQHGQLNASGPPVLSHQPQLYRYQARQSDGRARQPYVQAYHTRVYHPHRLNPQHPGAQPPANSGVPRRTAGERGNGAQPQPPYRSYESWQNLNSGNAIARRPVTQQCPAYRSGADSSAGYGSYGSERRQYTAPVPRSENAQPAYNEQTYQHVRELPTHGHSYFATRSDITHRPREE